MKILPKVGLCHYGNKSYFPGDIVEIDERFFKEDYMEKIEEPLKTKKVEPEEKPFEKEERVVVTEEGIETLGPGEEPSAPEIKPTPTPEVEKVKEKRRRKRKT